ncbi:MAG TPA: BTAD domain-containing putative transcriptional regulator [Actinomycetota bacterium]|nr:BTAD domain-containing putative transcriptional regulator [Actinomycetota bacterium]
MRFAVLGPLEVTGEDGPLPLGGPKQRILLAHLVLNANKVVSAGRLIDSLWEEDLPEDPRSALRVYVSRIRSSLALDSIEARAPGYRLSTDRNEVDALRFEDLLGEARSNGHEPETTDRILSEALELWRGGALADLANEPSLAGEIARLEELRLQAVEEKLSAEIELGQHVRVVTELETLTRTHPLREHLWGALMLALYRSDRQGEALAAFDRARTILADELGIDPSHDLRSLHERILRQDPDLDLEGEPLRGYRLLEQIGEGAFGAVYRAIQPVVRRDVAIKAIHPHLANDPEFIRRFEAEAQIVARLEHPHVVPLYDYWREPGGAYLVMRFLRGGNLAEALEDGAFDLERAAQMLDQVGGALASAHRQGVVHRDVKPSNILLDEEGNAYLADFGIAKDVVASDRTEPGTIKGSVLYLAPEQIRGEALTARTDVYALGVVLYEALVGEHPFRDVPDLAVYERQLHDPLPPARARRKDLPPAVDDVIATATAKDPRHRFRDAVSLADAFRNALPTAEITAVAAAPPLEARNPYKGLRPFDEADADDFFGREAFVDRLLKRWSRSGPQGRFLAVVGPSGSGKSSAVRAGLVPALRRGGIEGSADWFITDLVPGRHPMDQLEAALLRVAAEPPPRLLEILESGPRGLLQAIDRVLPEGSELVLVVDQFEEVFTLTEDEAERSLLLESLRVAAADPTSRVRIVLTLRADFYDRPLVFPRFGDLLGTCTEVVTPLAPDELERAIVRPASSVGQTVESALVAQVATDVAEQPGALPLVQYALTELFDRRQDGRLTLEAYREIGGIGGALAASAEHLFETKNAGGRDAVRELFLSLVTLGEGTPDTRRRVRLSELSTAETDPAAMESALDAYGRHRLLTFDRDPGTREPTVEVAHEALLGAWDRLRDWIDEARDDLRVRNALASAAADWETAGRDDSFLLRGARLERVASWAETTTVSPSAGEAAYLRASVERRDEERAAEAERQARERALERRSIRRLRGIVAALTAAALVASVLTAVAVDQRGEARSAAVQARVAETAQLAQRLGAQALVEEDLDLSLLLARQAVAIDDSPQTRGYLLAALRRSSPDAIRIMHGTGLLKAASISPDGKTLAVIGETDGLLLFDTETYRLIGNPLPLSNRLESVAYSPDGRTLAVGGDAALRLLDARTGEQLAQVKSDGVWRVAFTKDGSRLVTLYEAGARTDARITIRDATTLRPIGPSIEPDAFEGAVVGFRDAAPHFALTPDDRSLVTVSEDGELAVWDLRGGQKTRTLRIETGLHALALSPDGRTAAVGIEGGIQFVDLPSGEVRTATGSLGGRPTWLLFSPLGETVVSTNPDGTVTLWDVGSAAPRETLRGHWNSAQQPVFSPDGKTLYTVSHDGSAIAWGMTGEGGLARPFRFTSDRKSAIVPARYEGHPGEFSPDGRLIAVGLQGRGIALLDVRQLTPVGPPLLGTGGEVKSLAFSPDGRTLAASAFGNVITLWDVDSRSRLHSDQTERDNAFDGWPGLDFSPNGRMLAVTFESGVRLLDVTTGASLREIGAGRGNPDFSADGTMVATALGFRGGAVVRDVATGAPITTVDRLPGDSPDFFVALSPDGRTLAMGGGHPVVRLVDVRTGTLLHELDLAGTGAFSLEFSPDGRTLAVSGFESGASLWDVATGSQYGPTLTAGSGRTTLDVSPDGHHLLTAASNGEGAVWDIDPESWKQRACTIANRTLTREEWEEFLPGRPYDPACR